MENNKELELIELYNYYINNSKNIIKIKPYVVQDKNNIINNKEPKYSKVKSTTNDVNNQNNFKNNPNNLCESTICTAYCRSA